MRGKRELEDATKATDFDNLDLVPADFSYRNMDLELDATKKPTRRLAQLIRPLKRDYDYVFLDCPPSISLVSESVFEAADALVVPLIPTPLSVRTYDQLTRFVAKEVPKPRPRILTFFSMVDGRKTLHREIMLELTAGADGSVLDTLIPAASDVERMARERRALADFAPRGRAARSYADLWDELRARL